MDKKLLSFDFIASEEVSKMLQLYFASPIDLAYEEIIPPPSVCVFCTKRNFFWWSRAEILAFIEKNAEARANRQQGQEVSYD
jgi:hypothetical protein